MPWYGVRDCAWPDGICFLRQATENLAFEGWVRKTSRRTNVAKERYLKVSSGPQSCVTRMCPNHCSSLV